MRGLSTFRGLWVILVVAVLPIIISGIAAAAPGYPVEDPPGNTYTVAYNPSDHVLTVTDTTPTSVAPVESSTDEEAAGGSTGDVSGPNGQINHGQIVSQLQDLIDGNDRGCITSAVAESHLGKGDQQVRPNDSPGTVDLDPTVLNVECTSHGQTSEHPDNRNPKTEEGKHNSPGKSDTAPGKNK
jgi:hypothetical protein